MDAFPLIRTKWSNERLMAVVFAAAALYQLPGWVQNPAGILDFILVLAFGLALDVALNFIRFRKPVCAVSAAVTVSMLQALASGVPLWGRLLAVAVALLAGKHLWGGTGRNPVNPAMIGLLFLGLFFQVKFPPFAPSLLLVPAILLSLPFLMLRPYASVGMMAGMAVSLLLRQEFSFSAAAAYGIVFWGCLVVTDPVTVTSHPVAGAALGLLAGFVPLYFSGTALAMVLGVLAANLASLVVETATLTARHRVRLAFGSGRRIRLPAGSTGFVDLSEPGDPCECAGADFASEEILARIRDNRVFGMGGAAFPTWRKISTVLDSSAEEKHLIVNAVECDPGLIHDKWLLRTHPGEIEQGIRLLKKCVSFRSVTIAVKHAQGLDAMKCVAVAEVPDEYPAGAEKILIRQVLKKSLPTGAIPAEEGILVLNVQTVFSIYEAVCLGLPANRRFITVADAGRLEGRVARVRLDANALEIAEKVYRPSACVYTGGGMMQARIAGDEDTVGEAVNFVAVGAFPVYRESPLCSRCGLCAGACPAGLKVSEIARLVDEGNTVRALRYHPEECMSCGSCSHVCLAGRNLSVRVKAAKAAANGKHPLETHSGIEMV